MATSVLVSADPLDAALARVGDRWTLRLVDVLREGPRRFNDLLGSFDGLAPNVLSSRLKQLEADGIVVAAPYSDRPVRLEYRLTQTGHDLAGAVRLLAAWGAGRLPDAGAEHTPLHHHACGTSVEARWYCPTCHRVVDDDDTGDVRYV
jgi:DNA-binding HxlR family transcriptional regulator